jgi:hypothetical protein
MKTKLKDLLLYTFAGIGVLALLISATNSPQETISTVPESHIWEMGIGGDSNSNSTFMLYNKVTGEVRKHTSSGTQYSVTTEYDK